MLRLEVATLLRSELGVILPGGVWPDGDNDASRLSKATYPAAFNAIGEVLPVALVLDDGMFPLPATDRTVSEIIRVMFWQQRGRESIDAALGRVFTLLQGATLSAGSSWVYQIQFAGEGPNVRDRALADAEHGWSRWQAVVLR